MFNGMPQLLLSPTLSPLLAAGHVSARKAFERIAEQGFRYVQLSGGMTGMRPRDLDRSARRDLKVRMQRCDLTPSGIDLWIPVDHFTDPATNDAAVNAVVAAFELSADIGAGSVSIQLPESLDTDMVQFLAAQSDRYSVSVADHGLGTYEEFGCGCDPATLIQAGYDPHRRVSEMTSTDGAGLTAVRVSDCDDLGRVALGSGQLDIVAYRGAVATIPWHEAVILDLRRVLNPWQAMVTGQAAWDAADPFPHI